MTAEALVSTCSAAGLTVTTAESCTGGLLSGAITDVPGSSTIFERGFVTYSNAAKTEMLGVPEALLAEFGAVSEQVAQAMAKGALQNSKADIAVSVTGIAGPGGSEHKPEGRVCFAVATKASIQSQTVEFGAIGRPSVRAASVAHAIGQLLDAALKECSKPKQ